MIKAIFFDIDGTSYSHKIHDIPESTKKAFTKLKAAGYKLGICTSRSLEEMRELPRGFVEQMDAVVCIAGAQIYEKGKCISSHTLIQNEAKEVIRLMDEHHVTYRWVSDENENYLNIPNKEIQERFYMLYRMMPDSKAYEGQKLVHLLYYTHDEKLRSQIESVCQQNYHITLKYANEILAPNVNKGHGITECAQHWGIQPDEIAAFGDGLNDIEMLETAHIGVAMGNASDTLKNAADYVTSDVDHDGIYNACVHFGWIQD